MKLDKTITLYRPKYTDQNTKQVVSPDPLVLDTLEMIYIDNPIEKQYYVSIKNFPQSTMLFMGDDYTSIKDITKDRANERLRELSRGDMQSYLQNQFPRSLEDEPYGPGSILASMFSAIGIKSSPTCSCKRHALEMNRKGIEWCEDNMDTILGWLKDECEKRKIPWVQAVAKTVVNRAISKSKKYRDQQKK